GPPSARSRAGGSYMVGASPRVRMTNAALCPEPEDADGGGLRSNHQPNHVTLASGVVLRVGERLMVLGSHLLALHRVRPPAIYAPPHAPSSYENLPRNLMVTSQ